MSLYRSVISGIAAKLGPARVIFRQMEGDRQKNLASEGSAHNTARRTTILQDNSGIQAVVDPPSPRAGLLPKCSLEERGFFDLFVPPGCCTIALLEGLETAQGALSSEAPLVVSSTSDLPGLRGLRIR